MSKPVIKSASFDLKPIRVVRFNENLMLGTALDLNSSVAFGQTVAGIPTEVYFYDDTFMLLKFVGKTADKQYSQLIPWAQISTVIFD